MSGVTSSGSTATDLQVTDADLEIARTLIHSAADAGLHEINLASQSSWVHALAGVAQAAGARTGNDVFQPHSCLYKLQNLLQDAMDKTASDRPIHSAREDLISALASVAEAGSVAHLASLQVQSPLYNVMIGNHENQGSKGHALTLLSGDSAHSQSSVTMKDVDTLRQLKAQLIRPPESPAIFKDPLEAVQQLSLRFLLAAQELSCHVTSLHGIINSSASMVGSQEDDSMNSIGVPLCPQDLRPLSDSCSAVSSALKKPLECLMVKDYSSAGAILSRLDSHQLLSTLARHAPIVTDDLSTKLAEMVRVESKILEFREDQAEEEIGFLGFDEADRDRRKELEQEMEHSGRRRGTGLQVDCSSLPVPWQAVAFLQPRDFEDDWQNFNQTVLDAQAAMAATEYWVQHLFKAVEMAPKGGQTASSAGDRDLDDMISAFRM